MIHSEITIIEPLQWSKKVPYYIYENIPTFLFSLRLGKKDVIYILTELMNKSNISSNEIKIWMVCFDFYHIDFK